MINCKRWRYFKSYTSTSDMDKTCPKIKYLRYTSAPRVATSNFAQIDKKHHAQNRSKSGSVACASAPVLNLNKSQKVQHDLSNTAADEPQTEVKLLTNPTISAEDEFEEEEKKNMLTPKGDDNIDVSMNEVYNIHDIINNANEVILMDKDDETDTDDTRSESPYFTNKQQHHHRIGITNNNSETSQVFIPTPADAQHNNPYDALAPKSYTFPLFKASLIHINRIGQNKDRNMLILSDENNDGCLWKLLLINKYKSKYLNHHNYNNNNNNNNNNKRKRYIEISKIIQSKMEIYQNWFSMNICKWVYHFGANAHDPISVLPSSQRNSNSSVHPIDLEHFWETYY